MTTREEALQDLRGKMYEIAKHLPPWTLAPDPGEMHGRRTMLVCGIDGAGIHMLARDGRLHISGIFPQHYSPRYEENPRITVSAKRTPASIAGDIGRRFVKPYLLLFKKYDTMRKEWDKSRALSNEALDALADALGVRVDRYNTHDRRGMIRHYRSDQVSIEISTYSSTDQVSVNMELHRLPLGLAQVLCRMLNG